MNDESTHIMGPMTGIASTGRLNSPEQLLIVLPVSETTVDILEATSHLSRLVRRVEAGEQIVISRAGRPVARLVPVRSRTEPRRPGIWRGRVRFAPDFDRSGDDLLDAFET
jgi:prevent-host-death family protein